MEPWERQKGERSRAYSAFVYYRDMGPKRSLKKMATETGRSLFPLQRFSKKYNWVARATAWDEEVDRRRREAQIKEIEEMSKRQAQQAQAINQAIMIPVMAFLERLKKSQREKGAEAIDSLMNMLGTSDLLDLVIKIGHVWPHIMRAERLARGESTEAVEQKVSAKIRVVEEEIAFQRLIRDEDSRQLLCEVYRRIVECEDDARRTGSFSQSENMATSEASISTE